MAFLNRVESDRRSQVYEVGFVEPYGCVGAPPALPWPAAETWTVGPSSRSFVSLVGITYTGVHTLVEAVPMLL